MTIAFDPILLVLGPVAVRPFGLLSLLGMLVGVVAAARAATRAGIPKRWVMDALVWGLPAGIVCGRAVAVLASWEYYLGHAAEIARVGVAEVSLAGALWGGGLVGLARLRAHRPQSQASVGGRAGLMDVAAPGVLVAVAIGQVGALLEGAGQGRPADLAWATLYTSPLSAAPDLGVPRHPVQLYTTVAALLVWLVVQRVPLSWPNGSRGNLAVALGGAVWLALGAVRLEPSFLFGIGLEELLGGLALLVGGLQSGRLGWASFPRRRTQPDTETSAPTRQSTSGPDQSREGNMAA